MLATANGIAFVRAFPSMQLSRESNNTKMGVLATMRVLWLEFILIFREH